MTRSRIEYGLSMSDALDVISMGRVPGGSWSLATEAGSLRKGAREPALAWEGVRYILDVSEAVLEEMGRTEVASFTCRGMLCTMIITYVSVYPKERSSWPLWGQLTWLRRRSR